MWKRCLAVLFWLVAGSVFLTFKEPEHPCQSLYPTCVASVLLGWILTVFFTVYLIIWLLNTTSQVWKKVMEDYEAYSSSLQVLLLLCSIPALIGGCFAIVILSRDACREDWWDKNPFLVVWILVPFALVVATGLWRIVDRVMVWMCQCFGMCCGLCCSRRREQVSSQISA